MRITDALKGEHGVFYAQFEFLENAIGAANLATLQTLGAMLASALAPHAHIENEVLFPSIEERIGVGGPTTVMRMEHEHIEGMLARLQEIRELTQAHDEIEGALARLPGLDNADEARRLVRDVLFAAHEHFAKEENVLFPMAEQMLDERTLERLGREWAERRSVVLA